MAIADATKERLLETAGAVFAEKGYRSATVREICQRAQANLAAVNYYFGDKERLYVESIKRAHGRRVEDVPLPHWTAETPAEVRLQGFIETLLGRILCDPNADWHGQLMFREMLHPTAACGELVEEYIRPHFELLQSILADLSPPAATPEQLRLIAFGVVGQCLYFRIAEPVVRRLLAAEEHQQYQPGYLAGHIADWTLSALGRRPFFNTSAEARAAQQNLLDDGLPGRRPENRRPGRPSYVNEHDSSSTFESP